MYLSDPRQRLLRVFSMIKVKKVIDKLRIMKEDMLSHPIKI